MVENFKTRSIVESALMVGIIVIVSVLASYLSFFILLAMIIIPVIITIVYYRNGLKYSLCSVFVSLIINSIIIDPISGITLALCYGMVGLTLGYCIKSKKKTTRTILLVTVSFAIFSLLAIWFIGIYMGIYNPIEVFKNQINEISKVFSEIIEQVKTTAVSLGSSESELEVFEYFKLIFSMEILSVAIPIGIIISSFIQGCLCIWILELCINKIEKREIIHLDMAEIYISNLVGAALIATISICIILINKGVTGIDSLYAFTMMMTKFLLCVNGISATEYYLKKKVGIPGFPRVLIILATFILSSGFIYSFIGLGEMLLDFRKLDPHRLRKA